MSRPVKLDLKMARYLATQRAKQRRYFPFVTMLEPLEACNLRCLGCGRVLEYEDVADRRLSVEASVAAVHASGAPIVSIAGGEPLLHPQIDEIVRAITQEKRFVYLCTNGLLLREKLAWFKPTPYFSFVVHIDGTQAIHDRIVQRSGVYREAMAGIEEAIAKGFRVNTNSTVFHGTDVDDLRRLFTRLTKLGVEGLMISPGYAYEEVSDKELFLVRQESIAVFRRVLDAKEGFPFYNNPLYLDFLRGERMYHCAAWTTPTYTPLGWRKPCYVLADGHTEDVRELFFAELWDHYGPGNDRRCTNCMIHSGFEGATILEAMTRPRDLLSLVRGGTRG
jgi:hopanoid biosynthesis associated radical SAM protein HpnH